MKKIHTSHPLEIDKIINELGKKYQIHDLSRWNHSDRLRSFLIALKRQVIAIRYYE